MPPEDLRAEILRVVRRIPRGRVATYGEVALHAGWPRAARLVGRVLSDLPEGTRIPWHRVVSAGGRIASRPGASGQRGRLAAEGVAFRGGRVDLGRHAWRALPGPPA
jgi:methylated-DNA-protein-cysteine methyltransferase-like protein